MISLLHIKQLNRRSILWSAGCALLLAVSVLGLRLARTAGSSPPPVSQSTLAARPSSHETGASNPFDGGARIRTDRKVYAEPPLPALPRAGGKFTDPVFGTEIMRATDEVDCPAPGCGTYYSHWPTFNADNTYLLIRKGESGDALIKSFDPVSFTIGKGHQPAGIYVPGSGQTSVNFESAIWHPTDPHLIYCFSLYYDNGMRLYTYNVVTRKYTLVKDLTSLGGPKDYLHQMSMSADGDVFAWSQMREGGGGDPMAYIVWRKSTDKVLYHTPTPNHEVNEVRLDKSGQYLTIAHNNLGPLADRMKGGFLNLATGAMDVTRWNPKDSPAGHGDVGTGISAGFDSFAGGINKRRLDRVHQPQLIFRFQDEKGVTDWTQDFHGSLLADDESWITIGTYDDPSITGLPDTGVFEDEILQIALDGSGRMRRLLHTRSAIDNQTSVTGYWAMPKPTISKNGRFIAYTSNWEKSGRYDLFIARIEPAPALAASSQATMPAASAAASPSRTVRPRRVQRRAN